MRDTFFRGNVMALKAYTPGEQPAAGARVVKLNTNENPYPPSPRVAEAIRSTDAELRLYPDPLARGLRGAAAAAWEVPAEWILAGNGSDELLAMLVRAFVPEGGVVAYPVPTYSLYSTLVAAHGATAMEIPWNEDYSIPDGLDACDARLVFIARPNAPTGTVVTLDSLRRLARSLDGILCVDEAYVDFAQDNALCLVREFENVVILRTLSKSYSLAGARVGLAVTCPALAEGLFKIKDSYNLSRMALAAGQAALEDRAWAGANIEKVKATRATLASALTDMGIPHLPSQANFILARIGDSAREVYLALKGRGILVRYFDQDMMRDSLRISVGSDEEVALLVKALKEIVAKTRS
jgi:histidinol-phosphate aminotransferase